MSREKIVEIARSKIGIPWQHNQKAGALGLDCLRFWEVVAEEAGYDLPPIPKHYGWWGSLKAVVDYCESNFEFIARDEVQAGDLLILSYNGLPHFAIADWMEEYNVLGMIHCSLDHEKVVRHTIDGDILEKWKFSFRICNS